MNGSELIQAILIASTTVTSLLDTFSIDSTSYPAIFSDPVIPEVFTGRNVINFYFTAPIPSSLEYKDILYTVNCRAETYSQAEAIQDAVNNALNRKNPLTERGLFICSKLSVIPPEDERDDYNAPVEVRLKKL